MLDRIERKLDALGETLGRVQGDASAAYREASLARSAAGSAQETAVAVRDLQERMLAPKQAGAAPVGDRDGNGVEKLLGQAAGISRVKLVCHRDTWAFIVEHASRGEHFRLPVKISEESGGVVEVKLSGRSLLAVVDELRMTRDSAEATTTRQMAGLVYDRIEKALAGVKPDMDGAKVTRIVIDARARSGLPHGQDGAGFGLAGAEEEAASSRDTAGPVQAAGRPDTAE